MNFTYVISSYNYISSSSSSSSFFFKSHSEVGVQTGSTRHVGHFWSIVFVPGNSEDGEFGGMKIGKGNQSTRRKPAPALLCPQEIPLERTTGV
jgi:hypothetical protein